MKIHIFFSVLVLIISSSLSGPIENSYLDDQIIKLFAQPAGSIVRYANGELYNGAAEELIGDFALSSVSMDLVLAIQYFAMDNTNQQEMNTTYSFPCDNSLGKKILHQFVHNLNELPEDKFAFTSRIYYEKDRTLNPELNETAVDYLDTEEFVPVEFINFTKVAEIANQLIAQETGGVVTDFVKPENLQGVTALSVNTGNFNAEFEKPFIRSFQPRSARSIENSEKKIQCLIQDLEVNHGVIPSSNVPWFEVPLQNKNLSFFIFTPKNKTASKALQKGIGSINVFQFPKNVSRIPIRIPEINITSLVDMKKPVEKAGISGVLGNLSYFENDDHQSIYDILHKAHIEISEKSAKMIFASLIINGPSTAENEISNEPSNKKNSSSSENKISNQENKKNPPTEENKVSNEPSNKKNSSSSSENKISNQENRKNPSTAENEISNEPLNQENQPSQSPASSAPVDETHDQSDDTNPSLLIMLVDNYSQSQIFYGRVEINTEIAQCIDPRSSY